MKSTLHITYFALPGLLSEQDRLALDARRLTLSHLTYQQGQQILLAEQQFTQVELRLVESILQAYPRYCPTDFLLASYNNRTDELSIQHYRRKIKQGLRDGSYAFLIQNLKDSLIVVRNKLQKLNLDLYCLMETGYLLRKRRQEVTH